MQNCFTKPRNIRTKEYSWKIAEVNDGGGDVLYMPYGVSYPKSCKELACLKSKAIQVN